MKFTCSFLDILQSQEEFIQRKGSERWGVFGFAIKPEGFGQHLLIYESGDWVRVPLFSYETTSKDPAVALAFAVQLGFSIRDDFDHVSRINRIHLSIGTPVEEVGDHFRFWLGVAVHHEIFSGE